jgi:hypothetical protein
MTLPAVGVRCHLTFGGRKMGKHPMTRKLRFFISIALIAAFVLVGCRRARPMNTTPQVGVTGGGEGGSGGVSADPRQALEQVEAYLTSQGYARTGPAVRNTNLPANGVIAYAIEAQQGACYTIVAIAQSTSDLNLVVLDAQGQTISYNVDPDARPWATVCPGAPGRIIARLQMAAGGGEYYYAVYQGPASTQPDLAGLYSGGRSESGPQRAQLDQGTTGRLTQLDATLSQEGFTRISEPYGEQYAQREDRMFALNLQGGTCYAFASLGGEGARDTDVFLVDGQGNELEKDVTTNLDAVVRFCPAQTAAYQLRARMYSGQGPLFTVGYVQQAQNTTAQNNNTPPPVENVMATQSTAGAGIEENFRLLDADIRARGYQPYGDHTRGQLAEGQTRDFSIELEGGKCYAILGVGDNGVRDLDLILKDGSGQTLDQDVEVDARPIVRVCPEQTGNYTMTVRMYAGAGSFVYAPYRWPRGTRGPFNLSGLIYVRLGEVTSLLGVEGYEPDPSAAPGQGSLRREGAAARHNIQLEGGQCYAILTVGGQGIANVDLSLSQGSNRIATDDTRNAFPTVRHCPTQNGRFRLDVTAGGGSGRYFYQVFRRGGS